MCQEEKEKREHLQSLLLLANNREPGLILVFAVALLSKEQGSKEVQK